MSIRFQYRVPTPIYSAPGVEALSHCFFVAITPVSLYSKASPVLSSAAAILALLLIDFPDKSIRTKTSLDTCTYENTTNTGSTVSYLVILVSSSHRGKGKMKNLNNKH